MKIFLHFEKKELFCKGLVGRRSRFYTIMQWQKSKKNLMYINRFLRMPFSQMTFDMISDIYDQFSRSLITFIVLLKSLLSLWLYPIHTFWTGKESDSDILCAIHRHLQQQQFHIAGAAAQGLWFFFLRQEIQDALAVSLKNRTETQSNFMCLYEKEPSSIYL